MDQEIQPTVPVPGSPPEAPGIPNQGAPGGLSQEQMVANLEEIMAKIESRYQDFNSQKFSTDNKVKETQSESLRQVFDLFLSMGVDMNNPEEVKAFLDNLRQTNPEMSQRFEQALATLLGPEGEVNPETEMPSAVDTGGVLPENMNNNNVQPPQQNL